MQEQPYEKSLDRVQRLEGEILQLTQHISLADTLLDASIDLMLAIDTQRRVIAWNNTCTTVFGISKDDAVGRPLDEVIPRIKQFPAVETAIGLAMKGVKSFLPTAKGSFQPGFYENHFIPLFDQEQKVTGMLNLAHDTAHRVKAEQQLMRLNKELGKNNKELQQRNDELSSFIKVTSHDLKEPIRKVRSFADMLNKGIANELSEKHKLFFLRMYGNIRQVDMLTDDILAFWGLKALDEEQEKVNLNHILKVVQRDIQDFTVSAHALVTSDLLPSVPGYRNMLTLLFRNIIVNGIKFQPNDRRPQVNITWTRVSGRDIPGETAPSDAGYVRMDFVDNGIGFDNIHAERMFLMFHRLPNSINYPGTGMGLTTCKKIMDLHNGFIQADGRPGQGATIHCYFPLNQDPKIVADRET